MVLMNNDKHSANKGGSEKAVQPKTNEPENQPAEQSPQEEKVVGIGMPESPEEMEKRKENAKKMDR